MQKELSMSDQIIAEIIASVGAVIAAIIGGIFLLHSTKAKKEKNNTPNIKSGGNTIIASEKATQNIFFSPSSEPMKTPEEKRRIKLVETAEKIKERANSILIENEEILTPLFQPRPKVLVVRKAMVDLFNKQKSRADFSDWIGYLETEKEKEQNAKFKEYIGELLIPTIQLSNALYSNPNISLDGQVVYISKKKFLMADVLSGNVPLPEIRKFTEDYLEYLRDLISNIGQASGKIKSLVNSG